MEDYNQKSSRYVKLLVLVGLEMEFISMLVIR